MTQIGHDPSLGQRPGSLTHNTTFFRNHFFLTLTKRTQNLDSIIQLLLLISLFPKFPLTTLSFLSFFFMVSIFEFFRNERLDEKLRRFLSFAYLGDIIRVSLLVTFHLRFPLIGLYK